MPRSLAAVPPTTLVEAQRLIRRMRGGAQAHLLGCNDGRFYVVKFANNPQHRRVLVNEWIGSVFLKYLQIATPDTAIINVTAEFLKENPDVSFHLGPRRAQPAPGWHFGSRYPGDPARITVYDFLPDVLLHKVVNSADFLGVLVFDKWMANSDGRQAIFFRPRLNESLHPPRPLGLGFVAHMVDNGFTLGGPQWTFLDSPLQGLYLRSLVYEKVRGLDDFQPWLDQVIHFPEELVNKTLREIPSSWVADDSDALERLLLRLIRRRSRVPDLVSNSSLARLNMFPNWR